MGIGDWGLGPIPNPLYVSKFNLILKCNKINIKFNINIFNKYQKQVIK